MVNILVVYDDLDDKLDEFCLQCYYNLFQYFNGKNYNIKWIGGEKLDKLAIEEAIINFNEKPFICLVYAHGLPDALYSGNDIVVSSSNAYFFINSFFYTFSCQTGQALGHILVEEGCKTFIGYKDNASTIRNEEPHFAECANQGIKSFFEGKTALDALYDMVDKYEAMADEFKEKGYDFQVYSTFLKNKRSLLQIPLGDIEALYDLGGLGCTM